MSATDPTPEAELVVAEDGSIPAEQLARLGIHPGAHLRVVATPERHGEKRLAGSLPDFPEVGWEDVERASEVARHDASV